MKLFKQLLGTLTKTMLVLFDGLENKIDKEMLTMKKQLKEIPIMKQQIEGVKNSLSETKSEFKNSLSETKSEFKNSLSETKSEFKNSLNEINKELRNIINETNKELRNILNETNKEVRKISKSVAVIEHEHGDKLKMLFDAVTINSQKISEQGKEIKKLFKLYQNHDERIYLLESKVQGK